MSDERGKEVPWLLERCREFPALDVGCAESRYLTDLAGPVDGIDLRPPMFGGLREFFQDDIRFWEAPVKYPTVIALSTIEHIGLACDAYGTPADDPEEGDRRALEGCMEAVAPGGRLLLTVPFGDSHEDRGWYRKYSAESLDRLLIGFSYTAEHHYDPEWLVGGVALVTVQT